MGRNCVPGNESHCRKVISYLAESLIKKTAPEKGAVFSGKFRLPSGRALIIASAAARQAVQINLRHRIAARLVRQCAGIALAEVADFIAGRIVPGLRESRAGSWG